MKLLFLGVGNAHRGDDGVGPFLAEKLAENKELAARGVDVLAHGGEGASLMDLWGGADKVVIVDAMKTKRKHGLIQRFDAIAEKLHGGVFRYSSHLFGLAEAVEMSRALGSLPKEMIIYGIESRIFDFGAPLSAPVAAAAAKVEQEVLKDFGLTGKKQTTAGKK